MATHSNIPAWKIPWTEEPGGLQSIGLQRARHKCGATEHTHTPLITFNIYLEFMSVRNYNFYALSFLFLTEKPTNTLKNLMRYLLLGETRLEKSVNLQRCTSGKWHGWDINHIPKDSKSCPLKNCFLVEHAIKASTILVSTILYM